MSCDGRETSLSTQFLLMIVLTVYWKLETDLYSERLCVSRLRKCKQRLSKEPLQFLKNATIRAARADPSLYATVETNVAGLSAFRIGL